MYRYLFNFGDFAPVQVYIYKYYGLGSRENGMKTTNTRTHTPKRMKVFSASCNQRLASTITAGGWWRFHLHATDGSRLGGELARNQRRWRRYVTPRVHSASGRTHSHTHAMHTQRERERTHAHARSVLVNTTIELVEPNKRQVWSGLVH